VLCTAALELWLDLLAEMLRIRPAWVRALMPAVVLVLRFQIREVLMAVLNHAARF
jgi:hypothetical protein